MTKFDLINLLNNSEPFVMGLKYYAAIERHMGIRPTLLMGSIVNEISEIDGFENFSADISVRLCRHAFYERLSKLTQPYIEKY